jgi:Transposase DDE domain
MAGRKQDLHGGVPEPKRKLPKPRPAPERRNRLGELPIWPSHVVGAEQIRVIEEQIALLRDEDAHGNRTLFLDDVFVAYLLAFFNPLMRSLRMIEDFSKTRQAQRFLTIPSLPRSTLSDFNKQVEPERLQPIVTHLHAHIRRNAGGRLPNTLDRLQRKIIAVDGTFLNAAADVLWALKHKNHAGTSGTGVRLDFHVHVDTWLPEIVVVGEPGKSESDNAIATIKPDAIHIYDRGIFSFELVNALIGQHTDFVMRMREAGKRCPKFTAVQERPLSNEDRAAGVTSDRIGYLTGSQHRKGPDVLLREVIIIPPDDPQHPVRLLTSLLDVDAWIIGLLYSHRWQIELFFRWFKCYAQFDHLISHCRNGVLLAFYVAIVGVLLLILCGQARPSKYLFGLLGLVASGAATLEEILPIWRERERQNQVERDRLARKRAKKQS